MGVRAVQCTMAWVRSSGIQDYAAGVAPSIPLQQQFHESDPLALRDSQGRHPDGFTVFGQN